MQDVLEVFTKRDAEEGELREAAEALGPVTEPAAFWSAIAEDASYGSYHRACAIVQLLRRHVSSGATLGEVGRLLGEAAWVREADVDVVTALGGKIPVRWTSEDTVFVLAFAPGGNERRRACAYLRVRGRADRHEFVRLLRGEPAADATYDVVILEVEVDGPCSPLEGLAHRH